MYGRLGVRTKKIEKPGCFLIIPIVAMFSKRKGKQDWTLCDCEKPTISSSEHSRTHMTEKRYEGKDFGKQLSCDSKNG